MHLQDGRVADSRRSAALEVLKPQAFIGARGHRGSLAKLGYVSLTSGDWVMHHQFLSCGGQGVLGLRWADQGCLSFSIDCGIAGQQDWHTS
jgi:hypothetical protein